MKILYRMINVLTLILLSIALFFSFQSSTFTFFGLSQTFYLAGLILIPVAFLLLVFPPINLLQKTLAFIKTNNNVIFWLIFALLVVMQLVLINTFNTTITADAKIVLSNLGHPEKLSHYLSKFPNNAAYIFLTYFISKIFGTSLIVFKYFALISLDLSVIFLRLATKKYFNSRSIANIAALVFAYFTMLQPIFVFPYTDTFVLPYISLTILLIVLAFQNSKAKYLYVFLAGISASFTYLIRPSAIIFLMAFVIFLVISAWQSFGEIKKLKATTLLVITLLGAFAISTYSANQYINNQTIIKYDKSKAIPLVHFVLLGSYGDADNKDALHGTYNSDDFAFALSKPNEGGVRKKAELDRFIARTKDRGVIE